MHELYLIWYSGLELLLKLSQVCYTNPDEFGLYPQSLGLYESVPGSESCFIIVFLKVFFVWFDFGY